VYVHALLYSPFLLLLLLDLSTPTKVDEEYKLQSSSLYDFLPLPITPPLNGSHDSSVGIALG
jgi:hypothetical protein